MMDYSRHVLLMTCYPIASIGWKGKGKIITKMSLIEMELISYL